SRALGFERKMLSGLLTLFRSWRIQRFSSHSKLHVPRLRALGRSAAEPLCRRRTAGALLYECHSSLPGRTTPLSFVPHAIYPGAKKGRRNERERRVGRSVHEQSRRPELGPLPSGVMVAAGNR